MMADPASRAARPPVSLGNREKPKNLTGSQSTGRFEGGQVARRTGDLGFLLSYSPTWPNPMGLTYFKRYRMEFDLVRRRVPDLALPPNYRLIAWDPALLETHAETKYESFRGEIDASVFSCLGEHEGCRRLMREISRRDGFLPGATWLMAYQPPVNGTGLHPLEYCGTIQGLRDKSGIGAVQNLGIVPEHRDRGLGSALLLAALGGFRRAGLPRAFLEVTAQNDGAIRLYHRLGFRRARTVYKAVEVAMS
jgi:hypothetical protein